jgi:hypothetical protein
MYVNNKGYETDMSRIGKMRYTLWQSVYTIKFLNSFQNNVLESLGKSYKESLFDYSKMLIMVDGISDYEDAKQKIFIAYEKTLNEFKTRIIDFIGVDEFNNIMSENKNSIISILYPCGCSIAIYL